MPWRAQGLADLRWWQRMAGAPVVAIGGILSAEQVRLAASCGVDGVCVVRGLGHDPEKTGDRSFKRAFSSRWGRDGEARALGRGFEWGLCG